MKMMILCNIAYAENHVFEINFNNKILFGNDEKLFEEEVIKYKEKTNLIYKVLLQESVYFKRLNNALEICLECTTSYSEFCGAMLSVLETEKQSAYEYYANLLREKRTNFFHHEKRNMEE